MQESFCRRAYMSNLEQQCTPSRSPRPPVIKHVTVFVLGAGLSGISMLKKLKDAGITSVLAAEKASGVGGTWHWYVVAPN